MVWFVDHFQFIFGAKRVLLIVGTQRGRRTIQILGQALDNLKAIRYSKSQCSSIDTNASNIFDNNY
jgi:hypothetical protein